MSDGDDTISMASIKSAPKAQEKKKPNNTEVGSASAASETGEYGEVLHVHKKDEYSKLVATGLAVVDFSAKWCGPCRMIAPFYETQAKDYKKIKFLHVDIDEAASELKDELKDVKSIPTFKFYRNGTLLNVIHGANKNLLTNGITSLMEDKGQRPYEAPSGLRGTRVWHCLEMLFRSIFKK